MPSIANTWEQSVIEVTDHLTQVQARIAAAVAAAGRDPDTVGLLAVTKGQPTDRVAAARRLGLKAFGENYVQEALEKQAQLPNQDISWYFIGRLQSNKTRAVAERFDWVLSLDRERIAERLAAQRPEHLEPLNVCIQVKTQTDPAKGGVTMDAAADLAGLLAELPQLTLRGLMVIPPANASTEQTRACFQRGAEVFSSMRDRYPTADTLSMGMSRDLEQAIAEGSTLVRIGTDLFGPRTL